MAFELREDTTVSSFFRRSYTRLVPSPNGIDWWHNMPLPAGTRINGANEDKAHQFKVWDALQIPEAGGLNGKSVLDIGANDGFFTLAALTAGAAKVTAINSADWRQYPRNIRFASDAWGLHPKVITDDFRTHRFGETFDVILFLGVLYHLEDVFGAMKILRGLAKDQGVVYLETHMTQVQSDLPIFECASDIYPTVGNQHKKELNAVGLSNYLFPNEHAIRNLAFMYDFDVQSLAGPHNLVTQQDPNRCYFKLVKQVSEVLK
jgi:SAM-dependent methyltransferase